MAMRITGTLVVGVLCACTGYSQTWEVGGLAGFGAPQKLSVTNATGGSVQAGFTNGLAFGAVLGQRLYSHFTGEARYMYRAGDMKLSGNGQEPRLGAESHTMNYDLLIVAAKEDSTVRPFLAVGAGARFDRATANPPVFQPLTPFPV